MKLTRLITTSAAVLALCLTTKTYGQGTYVGMLQPNFGSLSLLTPGSDGAIYGIGSSGGVSNGPVFYRVDPSTTNKLILFNFPTNLSFIDLNGLARVGTTYYGASFDGGDGTNNNSVLFTIQEDGTGYNPFYSFHGRYRNFVYSTPLIMSNGDVITISANTPGANRLAVDRITTNGTVVFSTGTTQFLGLDTVVTLVSWHNNVYAKWIGSIYQIDPTSGAITLQYNNTNTYQYIEDIGLPANDPVDRLWAVNQRSHLYFTNGSWTPLILDTNKDLNGNYISPSIPVIGFDGAAYSSLTTGGSSGVGSIHRLDLNGTDMDMCNISDETIGFPGRMIIANDNRCYNVTKQEFDSLGMHGALNTPQISCYWNYQHAEITSGDINRTNGLTNTVVTWRWPAVRGQQYSVRKTRDFESWTTLTNIIKATNGTGVLKYTETGTNLYRFYEVISSNGIPSSYASVFANNKVYIGPKGPPVITLEVPYVSGTNSGPFTNPPPPPPNP